MADSTLNKAVYSAGDVDIQICSILGNNGQEFDLKAGFIGEINLFEDMYRPGLYGNILIVDAANLTQLAGLTGNELITIKLVTPSMDQKAIYKTFKIYKISDRIMFSDSGKQSYILHFCSPEVFLDALSPIYKTYEGTVNSIVSEIFEKKLSTSRTGDAEKTTLTIIGDAVNKMKFTSPGWRPSKCINWIASKAQEQGYNNPGYVFFESNKGFYFANVEHLIDLGVTSKNYYQDYNYTPNNLTSAKSPDSVNYTKDIDAEYKKVEDFKVIETYDTLKNTQNGYLANRLYTYDLTTKRPEVISYDHVNNYGTYKHMENVNGPAAAPFVLGGATGSLRNDSGFNQFYMKHSQLYTGFSKNVNDVIDEVLPRRTSTMAELTNFKLEITVPGRTDIEVGVLVNFGYPDASPRNETDKNQNKLDDYYSGMYLVTAVRHKINSIKHMMILELVKDSFKADV